MAIMTGTGSAYRVREGQVSIEERLNGTDVFPVVLEQVRLRGKETT